MKRYCEDCNYELDDGYLQSEIICGACVNVAESVFVLCPVGDLVGEPHEFAAGSGRLAFLDIMGLAGNVHEVCAGCAHPSWLRMAHSSKPPTSSSRVLRGDWIDKRVDDARRLAGSNAGGMMSVQRLLELLAIVEEFAGLLRDHFAEVEG